MSTLTHNNFRGNSICCFTIRFGVFCIILLELLQVPLEYAPNDKVLFKQSIGPRQRNTNQVAVEEKQCTMGKKMKSTLQSGETFSSSHFQFFLSLSVFVLIFVCLCVVFLSVVCFLEWSFWQEKNSG